MSTQTAGSERPSGNSFLGDVWINLRRWGCKAVQNPAASALELFLGVFSLILFTSVFKEAGVLALQQSGFGEIEYVTYVLPAVVVQVAMASAMTSGVGLVEDLQTGMFEKVLVSPMSWTAVFVGKAGAELLRIVLYLGVILGLGLAMGATIETGVVGVVGIVAVTVLFALWYMALSNVLALLTRDVEALDAAGTLLLFPLLFLSSGFLPVSSMPQWIQTFATFNPATYGVDAIRAFVLGRDVLTVVEVTAFGGIYDTLVPALAVIVGLDLVVGAVAVGMLARAGSAGVD